MAASIGPSPLKSTPATAEALAKETERSVEEITEIYEQELSELASEAKITQYLGVLATRRVKMRLREH